MKRRATALALGALLASGCAGAPGAGAPAAAPALRVGATFDYPPFVSGTPEDAAGLDVALVRELAGSHGRGLVFVRTTWPGLVADLVANRFDVAVGGVTVRPERSLAARFTTALVETAAVALVPDASPLHSLTDLDRADVRIAVNAGGHLERVARTSLPHASVRALPDNASVPGEIAAGRADAVLSDGIEAPRWQRAHPGLRAVTGFPRDRKAWLVRADDAVLAAEIDAWIAEREAEGALARARERELGTDATAATAAPLTRLVAAIDERLSLMPFVASAKRARGLPITDPTQEARVLDAAERSVAVAAAQAGRAAPSAAAVRALFALQIALATRVQHALLAREAATASPAPDLDGVVRPALARIGERLARSLVALPADQTVSAVADALRAGVRSIDPSNEEIAALARAIACVTRRDDSAAACQRALPLTSSRSMRTALPPSTRQMTSATLSNAA